MDPYCGGHTKRRYISHIVAFFSIAAITSAQNDIFIAAGFLERRYISVIAAKTGLLQRFYVPPLLDAAKNPTYSGGHKNAAIDLMYSGRPKTRRNSSFFL